jgi:hypothetical protein
MPTENTTAATHCRTCGQGLTEWTNHNGVTMLVADDGWGSICGDAPRGMHDPFTPDCHDDGMEAEFGRCHGALELTVSKSGCTRVMRCARHARAYHERMDALEARLQRDYPGYDNPASPPPAWFDASFAGERWDEED